MVAKINENLSQESKDYTHELYIDASKINSYRKRGFIKPPVKKKEGASFFEFEEIHLILILNAYRRITLHRMRTRDAFEQEYSEIENLSLF